MSEKMSGPLPTLEEPYTFFWKSGEQGELKMQRCQNCSLWIHPPTEICRQCHSEQLEPEALSGIGTIVAVTINHQPWMPGLEVPYTIAIVELDEQAGLRLTSNIIGDNALDSQIGQRVEVCFEQREDVCLPQFKTLPT